MNRWRLAAVALGTVFLCMACVGLAVYLNRQDLRWLSAPQPPPLSTVPVI